MSFLILVLWGGLCCLSLMLVIFLVKPLFSFTRSHEADNSVEVRREDCPELFAVIDDIVQHTGNKMPKHVYLSAEVNACVFFNSSFWSIFFPVRKNLKIGLGLFEGLSVDEIKSILAHEFGHFSQKSMKVGSSVYVVNQILYNMTYTEDFWDRLLDLWCSSSYGPWAIMGGLTRLVTGWIVSMNVSMYRFVERSYRKLSRQMEFDADNVSCGYVGSAVFISGICKTNVNSTQNDLFIDALKSLLNEKKIVKNVFDAYHYAVKALPDGYRYETSYDKPMTEPYEKMRAKSRVCVEGTWDSHPEIDARLDNARQNMTLIKRTEVVDAWSLIPDRVKQIVSDSFLSQIEDREELELINDEDFKVWIDKHFTENLYRHELRPFFARRIVPFDLNNIAIENKMANPFTERNCEIIEQFLVANNDWTLLNQIYNGEREVNHIEYDGKEVSKKALGSVIKAHKKYYEDLLNLVAVIDKKVYMYLMSATSDEESKNEIRNAYMLLAYTDYTLNTNLPNLFDERNRINERINETARSAIRTQNDIDSLAGSVLSYISHLQDCLKKMDMEAIRIATDDDYVKRLQSVIDMTYSGDAVLEGNFLNAFVINLPQEILHIHQILENIAKSHISKYAEQFADNLSFGYDDDSNVDEAGERLIVADYEAERDDTDHIGPWILFFAFAAFVLMMFCMKNCNEPTFTDPKWSPSAIESMPIDESTAEDTTFNIIDRNADDENIKDVPELLEGEINDENVTIILPKGVFAQKIDFADGNYAYDLFDNKETPNYSIRLISSHYADFDDLGFEKVWGQAKEQNEEGEVSADYGNLEKKELGSMQTYNRTTIYHGESEIVWTFIVLCDEGSDKIIILSCWNSKGQRPPLNDIIKNIKFTR